MPTPYRLLPSALLRMPHPLKRSFHLNPCCRAWMVSFQSGDAIIPPRFLLVQRFVIPLSVTQHILLIIHHRVKPQADARALKDCRFSSGAEDSSNIRIP